MILLTRPIKIAEKNKIKPFEKKPDNVIVEINEREINMVVFAAGVRVNENKKGEIKKFRSVTNP